MAIRHYLAMTGAEYRSNRQLPEHLGWLGCHFSPYGAGLSNLPPALPPGALVILDDITPIHGHDSSLITAQLEQLLEKQEIRGVLLDLQRQGYPEAAALAAHLADSLPCQVAVSAGYAQTGGAVLLPPPSLHTTLAEQLAPWQGREIWLETCPKGEIITLTEQGAEIASADRRPEEGFSDEILHIHYRAEVDDAARFTLWRTEADFAALLEEAEGLGVKLAVGLYQEWQNTI